MGAAVSSGRRLQHEQNDQPVGRPLLVRRSVKHWSLTTLREKLIKLGAKVVAHCRYVFFQMAEVAVAKGLFRAILERKRRLRPPRMVPG